jgi:hypothetical protein
MLLGRSQTERCESPTATYLYPNLHHVDLPCRCYLPSQVTLTHFEQAHLCTLGVCCLPVTT